MYQARKAAVELQQISSQAPSASAVPTEPEMEQPKSSPVLERVIPIQVRSQPVPNEPKPIAAEPKPVPTEPKPVPTEPKPVLEAEAILFGSEVVPADPAAAVLIICNFFLN